MEQENYPSPADVSTYLTEKCTDKILNLAHGGVLLFKEYPDLVRVCRGLLNDTGNRETRDAMMAISALMMNYSKKEI